VEWRRGGGEGKGERGEEGRRVSCAPISYFFPSYSTGGKGLPVAISALPSVQALRSLGFASWRRVGLLSGRMMGRSTYAAISRTISSVKALGLVEVPIRTCGFTSFTTEMRLSCSLPLHSLSSRAKFTWACVSFSPWDFRSRPGLSTHLG